MANLFPERLGIEKGLNSALAELVVKRIKAGNPNVEIVGDYKKGVTKLVKLPPTPKKSIEKETWIANKRSMILRNKQKSHEHGNLRFVHVFVAVEKAKGGYSFVLSMENECPYICEYCYLQGSLAKSPIPTLFTNFQDEGLLLRELKIALLAMHMHTQSHEIRLNIGRIQQRWVHLLMGILDNALPDKISDEPIQDIYKKNLTSIKEELQNSKLNVLRPILDDIEEFDFSEVKRVVKFNCGELGDALANDHLTDNSKFLVELFSSTAMRNDGAKLTITTKSDNIDNLKVIIPQENISISITIGTDAFVKELPSIDNRLNAAKALLDLGHTIHVNIDPMILMNSTISVYNKLLDKVADKLDHESDRFNNITIGMLRFGESALVQNIRNRHPGLYSHARNNMVKPKGEEKYRYNQSIRVEIYKALIDHIHEIMPSIKVKISTELPEVWKAVGLKYN